MNNPTNNQTNKPTIKIKLKYRHCYEAVLLNDFEELRQMVSYGLPFNVHENFTDSDIESQFDSEVDSDFEYESEHDSEQDSDDIDSDFELENNETAKEEENYIAFHQQANAKNSMLAAVFTGNLEILKWLRSKGCEWYRETTSMAASKGFVDCLRWALENGCPFEPDSFWLAIRGNHFDCLKYLVENGYKNNGHNLLKECIYEDNLKFFQYLHEAGYEIDDSTELIEEAIISSFSILQYITKLGYKWHPNSTFIAAKKGKLKVLKLAHETNQTFHPETTLISAYAANISSIDCFKLCFSISTDPENFWKKRYICCLDHIDFHDIVWRKFFDIDLSGSDQREFQAYVNYHKRKIQTVYKTCHKALCDFLSENILEHVVKKFI